MVFMHLELCSLIFHVCSHRSEEATNMCGETTSLKYENADDVRILHKRIESKLSGKEDRW